MGTRLISFLFLFCPCRLFTSAVEFFRLEMSYYLWHMVMMWFDFQSLGDIRGVLTPVLVWDGIRGAQICFPFLFLDMVGKAVPFRGHPWFRSGTRYTWTMRLIFLCICFSPVAELSVQVRRVTNLWSPQDAQQQSRDRYRDMPFDSSLTWSPWCSQLTLFLLPGLKQLA